MKDINFLKKYALNYLSKFDSTKNNLEKILKRKINRVNKDKREKLILYDSIKKILSELEGQNIINDENYANRKIQYLSTQGKSQNFIYSYLIKKGLKSDLIKESFFLFESNNPNWEEIAAKIFIKKKRIILNNNQNREKNLAKLARAGFKYDLIKKLENLF
tara:strand:- start:112 stop:594 length:483 start_codon:yes stop_codon:yes gene_type:complete